MKTKTFSKYPTPHTITHIKRDGFGIALHIPVTIRRNVGGEILDVINCEVGDSIKIDNMTIPITIETTEIMV